jgi:ABC-2 type transport system ATP-binding protein
MNDSAAIRTDRLTKRYDGTTAVDGLDLWIRRGSVYGFLGPNGAGKTTTMLMLTTLTPPTSGSASVAGADIQDREAVVSRIGYLPEDPPLHDELTATEQLRYMAGLRDIPEKQAEARIDELLAEFDLVDDADRRIGTYSKGMKQKTGIIQAILHRPEVVFLDEPTSGLDPRAARTVRDTIAALADEEDATVFLSTHILPVVDELADTVGVLSNGRLVTEGAPETLKRRAETGEEGTLEDVFLRVTSDYEDRPTSSPPASE